MRMTALLASNGEIYCCGNQKKETEKNQQKQVQVVQEESKAFLEVQDAKKKGKKEKQPKRSRHHSGQDSAQDSAQEDKTEKGKSNKKGKK